MLWYDLKKLLWQDELNPRVRCAFGNVYFHFYVSARLSNFMITWNSKPTTHLSLRRPVENHWLSATKNCWDPLRNYLFCCNISFVLIWLCLVFSADDKKNLVADFSCWKSSPGWLQCCSENFEEQLQKKHLVALCLPPNLKAANSKTRDIADDEDGDDPTADLCQVEVAGASEGYINNYVEISNNEMISIKRRLNRIEYHDMIFVVFDKNYHFRWNRHLLLEEDLRVEAVGTLERTLRLSPTRAKTGTKMVLIKGCTTCQGLKKIWHVPDRFASICS